MVLLFVDTFSGILDCAELADLCLQYLYVPLTLSSLIFWKWTFPSLNLDMSTAADSILSLKSKTEWQTV